MIRLTVAKFPSPRFDQATVARRMRAARKDAGLTTEELAEGAKVGLEALYKKMRGSAPFQLDELSRLCDVLKAPSLFPFLDWDVAALADKLLDRHR